MILTRSLILDFRTRLLLVSKGIGVDGGVFPAPGDATGPAASFPSKQSPTRLIQGNPGVRWTIG